MNPKRISIFLLVIGLAACAPAPFIPVADDTYTVSQTTAGGMFKSMSSLRSDVISRANEFASSKGKSAIMVDERESPGWPGKMPSFTYTFRLAEIPKTSEKVANGSTAETGDYYDKLLKLDDLRKKGIITNAEFDAQKAKILSGN